MHNRKASAELQSALGIECLTDVVGTGAPNSLRRWFGHVEWKYQIGWVKFVELLKFSCLEAWLDEHGMNVSRGSLVNLGLKQEFVYDRVLWMGFCVPTCQYQYEKHIATMNLLDQICFQSFFRSGKHRKNTHAFLYISMFSISNDNIVRPMCCEILNSCYSFLAKLLL
jgi:hypothetical protein